MSILIKGIDLPEAYTSAWLTVFECVGEHTFMKTHKVSAEQIQAIPPHGRLIDADALYEKTAEWEAQALHMVEKTMNDEDKSEWRKWSVVLTERSAFKYDVADMPTIIEAEEGEA